MRIVFVGDFRYNSGSGHVIYNFFLVANKLGHEVYISSQYGSLDKIIPQFLPLCPDLSVADRVIFVFESNAYINAMQLKEIDEAIPRKRRIIVDPDGRFNETIFVGDDTNHSPPHTRTQWRGLYESLSDVILQPVLVPSRSDVIPFLYFALEKPSRRLPTNKTFSILYIGNNWYRWDDVVWLFTGLRPIRDQLGRIALKGKWWDGVPKVGLEKQTTALPQFLIENGVEIYPSVPFAEVVIAMSEGIINPIFIRPMIAAQGLATPRMFETVSADTIPVLGPNATYLETLYGEESRGLSLTSDPLSKISEILSDPTPYVDLVSRIRERLSEEHSYEKRFQELMGIIG